jgi:hypothetical protein
MYLHLQVLLDHFSGPLERDVQSNASASSWKVEIEDDRDSNQREIDKRREREIHFSEFLVSIKMFQYDFRFLSLRLLSVHPSS